MLDNFLKDLEELVNVDCGTHNQKGVTFCAEVMKRHYESIGWHAELVDLGPEVGRGMLATNKPGAEHFDLLLNGHLDTVFQDGEAAKRPMSRNGDHINGPGCCDCKSGVLSSFYAMKHADPKDLDRLAILVAYNPDEETGSSYSAEWLEGLAKKCTRALVFEAARPNGELVRARKGAITYFIEFHGVSAHAGNNPEVGRSALLAAARCALELSKLQDLDGKGTSVNVTVSEGVTAANIIPEYIKLAVDLRFWRDEDGEELCRGVEALGAQNWGEDITTTVKLRSALPAMPFSDLTKELSEQLGEAAKMSGFDISWVDAGGGSDANHIAKNGTPVIDGIGPAGGAFHCDREYLRIDTIEERINLVRNFLKLI